jgi:dTDP-glucose 4,6-dehydratase
MVCGGAGFIGSNFIHYMLGKYPDYEIINYDKLTYAGNLDNLESVASNPHYHFEQGDITDLVRLNEVIQTWVTISSTLPPTHVDDPSMAGSKTCLTNSLVSR